MSTNSVSESAEVFSRRAGTAAAVRRIEAGFAAQQLTRRCKNFEQREHAYLVLDLDRFKARRVYRVGHEVEEGKWWVEVPLSGDGTAFDYEYFDAPHDMPPHIGDKVLVLCTAPDAFVQEGVGRRICEDRFWVYVGPEEQSENTKGEHHENDDRDSG